MAIVTFQREADAYAARARYNGKLIDSRTYVSRVYAKIRDVQIIHAGISSSRNL